MKNKNTLIIVILVIVVLALGLVTFYLVYQSKQNEKEMNEMVEQMNFEKEQVQKEFEDMTTEFDGYTINVKNDSIFKLLENEKLRVKQLLEELRVTKSTNARKISELKKELATVRQVMIHYVNQIDSLNAENKVLRTENVEVKRKYQEASQTVQQLSKDKESLNEVVTRASKLEVTAFNMIPLNNRNKKVGWFSEIANLQFNYTIGKNVTAPTGDKTLYLRITKPDNDVLTKSQSNVFQFENKRIVYSAKKDFEYTGDAQNGTIYWKVEEILPNGTYRADFFTDGSLIGSFNFNVKK